MLSEPEPGEYSSLACSPEKSAKTGPQGSQESDPPGGDLGMAGDPAHTLAHLVCGVENRLESGRMFRKGCALGSCLELQALLFKRNFDGVHGRYLSRNMVSSRCNSARLAAKSCDF